MGKINNIYIKRARRKRFIKRILLLTIISIILITVLILKTSIFKINSIKCTGENVLTREYILKNTKDLYGKNLFVLSKNEVQDKLKKNPYVKELNITKQFPKTLVIDVKEAKGLFYINDNNKFVIVSSDLVCLEKKDNIENLGLIEIKGVDVRKSKIGDTIKTDSRVKGVLNELYDEQGIINDNKESFSITSVDVTDLSNIKVNLNNIQVLVGNDVNIRKKMSNAILIFKTNLPKEYINVSFNGTPDFK